MLPITTDVAAFLKTLVATHVPKLAPYQPGVNQVIDAGAQLIETVIEKDGLPALTKSVPTIAKYLTAAAGVGDAILKATNPVAA